MEFSNIEITALIVSVNQEIRYCQEAIRISLDEHDDYYADILKEEIERLEEIKGKLYDELKRRNKVEE